MLNAFQITSVFCMPNDLARPQIVSGVNLYVFFGKCLISAIFSNLENDARNKTDNTSDVEHHCLIGR